MVEISIQLPAYIASDAADVYRLCVPPDKVEVEGNTEQEFYTTMFLEGYSAFLAKIFSKIVSSQVGKAVEENVRRDLTDSDVSVHALKKMIMRTMKEGIKTVFVGGTEDELCNSSNEESKGDRELSTEDGESEKTESVH